jgi:hypothetical protein
MSQCAPLTDKLRHVLETYRYDLPPDLESGIIFAIDGLDSMRDDESAVEFAANILFQAGRHVGTALPLKGD